MQIIRRFRLPALFCAFAVLVCELIARPYTDMGVCDDWSYILTTQKLAATGHIVYVGWAAAMLGWQLYLGAAFIKLFGVSLTAVRMSTLLVAMALAFALQRTLVRADISERNATIGTLALVLSPLYLMLSVTFMSDIFGLFAIVVCLYGCLRALQASTSRATIGWLCFAVFTNAICGTSRQIAWLGVLVMVPSTLWLLRAQRRVVLAGAVATLVGALFIFVCMQWFKHQPYSITTHLFPKRIFTLSHMIEMATDSFLDLPFLVLPVVAIFFPQMRNRDIRFVALIGTVFLAYIFVTIRTGHLQYLEPTYGDWVNKYGMIREAGIKGDPKISPGTFVRALVTLASFGGLLGLVGSLLRLPPDRAQSAQSRIVSWQQLAAILVPFTIAYLFLLLPMAITLGVSDRYFLGILLAVLICLVRYYQERVQQQLPLPSVLLVGIMAIYGIAVVHNTFALYRARVAMASEVRATGVPDTAVDNGWEYNIWVELQHVDHINVSEIEVPAHAYVPAPALPVGTCSVAAYDYTPHIHPLYGISFDPNACYGPAPFAPIHYSRWLASQPGTLYVVRYTASATP